MTPTPNENHDCFKQWKKISHFFSDNKINQFELVSLFIFMWSIRIKPQKWKGSKRNLNYSPSEISHSRLSLCEVENWFNLNINCQKIHTQDKNLYWIDWFLSRIHQTFDPAALIVFDYWLKHPHKLILLNFIPTPYEVLKMQMTGSRCLTLLFDPENPDQVIANEMNSFDFLIHDLIHADRFFKNSNLMKTQIFLYSQFDRIYLTPVIQKLIQANPEFEQRFHYIISDMNSHPIHILKTLRALIDQFQNAQPHHTEVLNWNWLAQQWHWTHDIINEFMALNTPAETTRNHEIIFCKILTESLSSTHSTHSAHSAHSTHSAHSAHSTHSAHSAPLIQLS